MNNTREIKDEIFYHVFQRSFYDSKGDQHGDFQGLASKLDYIQELGASSILILPIYDSVFYHNYFATDFRKIDPRYGTLEDYFNLIRAVHARGMKLYLDMEVQYVTEDHIWFKESYGNPESPYGQHILYNGPNNTEPESIIFDLAEIHSYDGNIRKVACLNLFNPETQDQIFKEFAFWVDPHGDGTLRDGIDGFRLDHMMDDLDDKGRLVGVYSKFWKPLIGRVKEMNSDVKFIGEQADWSSHGIKAYNEAGVDFMFAFPLKYAISNFNKGEIEWAQEQGVQGTPEGKKQIIIIENHDTTRYASSVSSHPAKLKIGAALNILLKGAPAIYYGQELGMEGEGGFGVYGVSDGNDIPRREAFPWQAKMVSPGSTLWYKDSGPWWNDSKLADDNGISVEEQISNPDSLLNFYKKLIFIRKTYLCIQEGEIEFLDVDNDYVLSFLRKFEQEQIWVVISLSDQNQHINFPTLEVENEILTYPQENKFSSELVPYCIHVLTLKN
ncbi:alpha-amylase family glycosyl hydrolase [Portibacter marinus]|uniref:alpha-amylase family glycosyl hydrolase n=1 Tax=Portibacter marinus TaxID=2898660 RepID=UPI001F1DB7A7|nr:alpha-amylase family glycosyl hydrolase [Portibacter marinus]